MVQFLSTDYGIFPGPGAGIAEVAGAEAGFRALGRLIVTSSLVSVGPRDSPYVQSPQPRSSCGPRGWNGVVTILRRSCVILQAGS